MAAIFSSVLAIIALGAEPGGVGLPLGIPPGPEDPVIARVAPEKCLFYVNWTGTASPDPKSPSETERFLAEPEVQHFLREMGRAIVAVVGKLGDSPALALVIDATKPPTVDLNNESAELARDALDWCQVLLTHPTAVFVSDVKVHKKQGSPPMAMTGLAGLFDFEGLDAHGGMVVSLGSDAARIKTIAEKHLKTLLKDCKDRMIEEVQIGGRRWTRLAPKEPAGAASFTCGFHGDYFIVGMGDGSVEAILDRMEKAKQPPAWLTTAEAQVPVPRRTGIIYLNLKALREEVLSGNKLLDVKAIVEMLGLGNATALISTVGLDDRGFVNKVLLALEGPPQGLLRLVSHQPLRPEDLAPIPRDATLAMAFRLDAQQAMETVLSSIEKLSPEARTDVNQALDQLEHNGGIDVRRGLLPSLGDTWCIYNSPGEGGLVLTGLTAVVPLKSNPAFSLAYTKLMDAARNSLAATPADPFDLGVPALGRLQHFTFAGREVCYVNQAAMSPAWCVTPTELVLALNVHNMKAYLSRREHKSLATAPEVAEALSAFDRPVMVGYCDTPKLFELLYPLISMYVVPLLSGTATSADIDLDLSFWPSAPSIARHLRLDVTTLERTRHGIQVTSRYSLPTGGMYLPAVLLAWWPAVMPMYFGDFERRAEPPVAVPPAPAAGTMLPASPVVPYQPPPTTAPVPGKPVPAAPPAPAPPPPQKKPDQAPVPKPAPAPNATVKPPRD